MERSSRSQSLCSKVLNSPVIRPDRSSRFNRESAAMEDEFGGCYEEYYDHREAGRHRVHP